MPQVPPVMDAPEGHGQAVTVSALREETVKQCSGAEVEGYLAYTLWPLISPGRSCGGRNGSEIVGYLLMYPWSLIHPFQLSDGEVN